MDNKEDATSPSLTSYLYDAVRSYSRMHALCAIDEVLIRHANQQLDDLKAHVMESEEWEPDEMRAQAADRLFGWRGVMRATRNSMQIQFAKLLESWKQECRDYYSCSSDGLTKRIYRESHKEDSTDQASSRPF